MTSLTTPKETGRGADIPAPRGGQGVRLLVLGADEDARLLRERAVAAGLELAQRYSPRVSHVAYGSGVDPEDGRYAKIRDAGLALLPIQACAAQLGLGATPSTPDSEEEADERDPGSDDFYEDDEFDETGPDPLAYPPLPDEDPVGRFLPGFSELDHLIVEREYDREPTDADADADPVVAPEAVVRVEDVAGAQDVAVEDAVSLAGAVVGVDPWLGLDADEAVVVVDGFSAAGMAGDGVSGDAEVFAVEALGVDDGTAHVLGVDDLSDTAVDAVPDPASAGGRSGGPRQLVFSFIWALIPLVSLGLLTPVAFGYAAVRMRSQLLAAATLGYALAVVLAFALSAAHPQTGSTATGTGGLLTFALAVSWLGGTGHALSLRAKVFGA